MIPCNKCGSFDGGGALRRGVKQVGKSVTDGPRQVRRYRCLDCATMWHMVVGLPHRPSGLGRGVLADSVVYSPIGPDVFGPIEVVLPSSPAFKALVFASKLGVFAEVHGPSTGQTGQITFNPEPGLLLWTVSGGWDGLPGGLPGPDHALVELVDTAFMRASTGPLARHTKEDVALVVSRLSRPDGVQALLEVMGS